MKYLHLSYITQIKHCPIRGLFTNLGKIHVTRTRNLHPTHRRSLARFVESNVCTQAILRKQEIRSAVTAVARERDIFQLIILFVETPRKFLKINDLTIFLFFFLISIANILTLTSFVKLNPIVNFPSLTLLLHELMATLKPLFIVNLN